MRRPAARRYRSLPFPGRRPERWRRRRRNTRDTERGRRWGTTTCRRPTDRAARRCGDAVPDLTGIDRGYGGVTAADVEPEVVGGEAPRRQRELELRARRRIALMRQDLVDRLAPPEEPRLFVRGAHDVSGRTAGE